MVIMVVLAKDAKVWPKDWANIGSLNASKSVTLLFRFGPSATEHLRTERSSLSEIFPSLFTSHFAKALLKHETSNMSNPRPKQTP